MANVEMQTTREFWTKNRWDTSGLSGEVGFFEKMLLGLVESKIDLEAYRYGVGVFTLEMIRRGVAPRWCGLIGRFGKLSLAYGDRKDLMTVVAADFLLWDLVWLHREFSEDKPKPKVSNKAWSKFYTGGEIDLDLAWSIIGRKGPTNSAKAGLLGVGDWRGSCCLVAIDGEVRTRVSRLGVGRSLKVGKSKRPIEPGIQDVEDDELDRLKGHRLSLERMKETAARFAMLDFAAKVRLGQGDPLVFRHWQDTQRIHKWVTGEEVSRRGVERILRARKPWVKVTSRGKIGGKVGVTGDLSEKATEVTSQNCTEVTSRDEKLLSQQQVVASQPPIASQSVGGHQSVFTPTSANVNMGAKGGAVWVGIDPGETGAVGVIVEAGEGAADYVEVHAIPLATRDGLDELDGRELVTMLQRIASLGDHITVIVEDQHRRPNDRPEVGWRLGPMVGAIRACLDVVGMPFTTVTPEKWTKALDVRKGKVEPSSARKLKSIRLAEKLFPSVAPIYDHDHGKAEALLLAHYGRVTPGTP